MLFVLSCIILKDKEAVPFLLSLISWILLDFEIGEGEREWERERGRDKEKNNKKKKRKKLRSPQKSKPNNNWHKKIQNSSKKRQLHEMTIFLWHS